nr:fibronectin type III domain-containing protein [Paenibacillus qinlingensis]
MTIVSPTGSIVASSFYDLTTFVSGQKQKFPFSWSIPATVPSGEYRVSFTLKSSDHKKVYASQQSAAVIEVKPPAIEPDEDHSAKYVITAHTKREKVGPGEIVNIAARVKSSEDTTVLVDVEVYSPSKKKVHQGFYDYQALVANKQHSFGIDWQIPAGSEQGVYTVWVGVFKPGWGQLYAWESIASKFQVTNTPPPVDRTPPSIPSKLIANAGEGKVTLQWSPVQESDLGSYNVYVSKDNGGTWDSVFDVGLTNDYTVNGLNNGTTYSFAITAKDLSGNESAKSVLVQATPYDNVPTDTTPPSVPVNVSANAGDGTVTLQWSPVTESDLGTYMVYVSKDNGTTWEPVINVGNATSYKVENLTNGTNYSFTVTAKDLTGNESAKSAIVEATPSNANDGAPRIPQGFEAEAGDGSVTFHWQANTEADLLGYRLYTSLDSGATWDDGYYVEKSPFTKDELENGKPYTFAVTALNYNDVESAKSKTVTATPVKGPPPVPGNLISIPEDKSVALYWDRVLIEDLKNYNVYVTDDNGVNFVLDAGTQSSYTVPGLINGVEYTFQVTAVNQADKESRKSAVSKATPVNADITPPAVPSGLQIAEVKNGELALQWQPVTDTDWSGYRIYKSMDHGVTWGEPIVAYSTDYLANGLTNGTIYTFAITAYDVSGNESEKSEAVSGTPTLYTVPSGLKAAGGDGQVKLSWDVLNAADLGEYKVYTSLDNGTTWQEGVSAGKATVYTAKPLENGKVYTFAITAVRSTDQGESNKSASVFAKPDALIIPPDPVSVAPPLPATNNVTFEDTVSFLYEGQSPIQSGVTPGTFEEESMSVITGRVLDAEGNALPGVKIEVMQQENYGHTGSRLDGAYDLVVNGGSTVTLNYEKTGYMTVQRKAPTGWNQFYELPDVRMTPYDTKVTTVDLSKPDMQVAQGNTVTDEDGTRKATMLFQPGTQATIKLADGTEKMLDTLNVRATEYTVGEHGREAMPGEVPPNVAYTYAVELSADEAVAAGATDVSFDKTVYVYVDNFLELRTGSIIPNGYYNLKTGAWEAETDGVVVKIVDIVDGLARIDMNGDGIAETDEVLAQVGWTEQEKAKLASLYASGTTLWRMPVTHFSPHDYNPCRIVDERLLPPKASPMQKIPSEGDSECNQWGSIIGCESQTLGQQVPIEGTPFLLDYNSRRTPGFKEKNAIYVPVTDDRPLVSSILYAEATFEVAGQTIVKRYPTSELHENLEDSFAWDGLDKYGRKMVGQHKYTMDVAYGYPEMMNIMVLPYEIPNYGYLFGESFGKLAVGPAADEQIAAYTTEGRDDIAAHRIYEGLIESPNNLYDGMGIAGWKLDVQTQLSNLDNIVIDEMEAKDKDVIIRPSLYDRGNVVGSDGSFYTTKGLDIFKIKSNDKGSEKVASLPSDKDLLLGVGPTGTLFTRNTETWNISRKQPKENKWTNFAGNGTARSTWMYYKDGTDARGVSLSNFEDYEVGPDESLYFVDKGALYRISPDSEMYSYTVGDRAILDDRYKGTGSNSGEATKMNVGAAESVEVAPDGTIYIMQNHFITTCNSGCPGIIVNRIKAIDPSGSIRIVAGKPFASDLESEYKNVTYNIADGADAAETFFVTADFHLDGEGNMYFLNYDPNKVKVIYKIDKEGIIHEFDPHVLEMITLKAVVRVEPPRPITSVRLLQAGPDGNVYFSVQTIDNTYRVFRYGVGKSGAIQEKIEPDDNGIYAQVFDMQTGRQLKTVSSLTGKTHFDYKYDAEGRLISLVDYKGDKVTIHRDTAGVPVEIESAYGQVTKLRVEDGQLLEITSPAGEVYRMTYDESGLMTQMTDPENNVKKYGFGERGRLIRAQTPREGVKTLQRADKPNGYTVTFTDPDNKVTKHETTLAPGSRTRTVIDPLGFKTTVEVKSTTRTTKYSDGTTDTELLVSDEQWGEEFKRVAFATHRSKTNEITEIKYDKFVELENLNNPLSLKSLKTVQTIDGMATTSEYFPLERKVVVTSSGGQVNATYMDEWDRTVKTEEPGTGIAPVLVTYDEHGRVKMVSKGEQYLIYSYNDKGLVATVTDADNHVKTYTYDDANRVETLLTPGGRQYRNGYDKNGNLTEFTMPNGEKVQQKYSADNEFEGISFGDEQTGLNVKRTLGNAKDLSTLPSGRTIDYIMENNQMVQTNDNDLLRSFSYVAGNGLDLFDKITSVTKNVYADTQTVDFGYDENFNINSAVFHGDANGQFQYEYNKLGLMTGMTSTVVSATYGQLNVPTVFDWDSNFRMTRSGDFNYKYEGPNGRLSAMNDSKLQTDIAYDDMGRLNKLVYKLKGVEVYKVFLTYNKANLLESKQVISNGKTSIYEYTYDEDAQLKAVTRKGEAGEIYNEAYEYDVNKNLTNRELLNGSKIRSQYGPLDELQQVGDVSYKFNVDGQLTQRGEDTFHYGAKDELLEAIVDGNGIHYTYDAVGRLVARENAQGKTQYLYGNITMAKTVTATIDSNGVITLYNYDVNGLLISLERNGQTYYVVSDNIGTPQLVLDESGNIVKELFYDSFGLLQSDSNAAFRLDIGFAGGIADEDTGFVRFGSRDYDPVSARWTAKDSIFLDSKQANMYAYVGNNPIMLRDPCGQACVGGSFYNLVGGGAKICIDDEGMAFCGEIGVGVGGGVELNLFEEVPLTSVGAEAAVKIKYGPVGINMGIEGKLIKGNPCFQIKPKLTAGAGPLEIDLIDLSKSKKKAKMDELGKKPTEVLEKAIDKARGAREQDISLKNNIEASAKLKGCISSKK